MSDADRPARGPGRLLELAVADDPAGWVAAGFAVDGDLIHLDATVIRLVGRTPETKGIVSWTLAGLAIDNGSLDGLPTATATAAATAPATTDTPTATGATTPHPNGVTSIDHVVVLTPDLDRTIEALATAGLDLRRIRDTESYGAPMRQAFFKLGPIVLEVVSGAPANDNAGTGTPATDAPSAWFGLAVNATDLDALATHLGEGLGAIKVAVQPGRRIATLRHKDLGLSVAVAVMDDHADR